MIGRRKVTDPNATTAEDRAIIGGLSADDILRRIGATRDTRGRFNGRREVKR